MGTYSRRRSNKLDRARSATDLGAIHVLNGVVRSRFILELDVAEVSALAVLLLPGVENIARAQLL